MLTVAERQFVQEQLNADVHDLLLAAHRYPGLRMPVVVGQLEALRKIRLKLPEWYRFDLDFPPALSVEQASSAETARFKSGLFSGRAMADLTGGMGVDAWFFAKQFSRVLYVEQNPELASLAGRNFDVLGADNITVQAGTAEAFLQKNDRHFDLIYLDPARRDGQQKRLFRFSDCQPNVLEIKEALLSTADRVLIKAAPMLDLNLAAEELGAVAKVWVVSVDGECKEVLYLLEAGAVAGPETPIEAVCLGVAPAALVFSRRAEQLAELAYSEPLRYLYEPDAALLKAGAFRTFARHFGLKKLHPNTHLYTSETWVREAPGRQFQVEAMVRYDRKALREVLPEGRALLAARNFPDSVEQMRKKLGLADGGDWFVFGVTSADARKKLLVCRRAVDNK